MGSILLGVFAQEEVNGVSGLIEGNGYQFGIQIAAACIIGAWSVLVTVVLLLVINIGIKIRVSEDAEMVGLDILTTADHGAYDYDRDGGALADMAGTGGAQDPLGSASAVVGTSNEGAISDASSGTEMLPVHSDKEPSDEENQKGKKDKEKDKDKDKDRKGKSRKSKDQSSSSEKERRRDKHAH
ncbi:hypothetical protein Pelo_11125 [Pelomyxa schiedti]|nr:hypothetical protein Pelo_11125 [Pelomyxa schiedti]